MRLFVALALPDGVKLELVRVGNALSEHVPGARWVPRENHHLTLSFLGQVADERVAEISSALGRVASTCSPGEGFLAGVGAFPSERRARVVWVGFGDPAGTLASVAGRVVDALTELGFPPEHRPFRGHITVARLKQPAPLSLPAAIAPEQLAVPIDAITLFRSHGGRPAPVYEVVQRFPLGP